MLKNSFWVKKYLVLKMPTFTSIFGLLLPWFNPFNHKGIFESPVGFKVSFKIYLISIPLVIERYLYD